MGAQGELNFMQDEGLGGFRLHRFEMLNWGTFDGGVRVMPLNGQNGLLTGDNGSGKSTVMDAITTLLISPSKLLYNKAAGSETKERTLKSYVEGYYRSERSEDSLTARPVALRKPGSYSVLLGYFHNRSLNADLTLAQVFWMSENHSQPDRFYAAAERDMSIVNDFSNFSDIKALRKRHRDAGVQLFDSYPQYAGYFQRVFGIRNNQALDLFNQTVSMKTIGELTGFVRTRMLERFDSAQRVQDLIRHFDDLTGAHDAVLKAKKQIEMLAPIESLYEKYTGTRKETVASEAASAAVDCWMAGYKAAMYEKEIKALEVKSVALHEKTELLSRRKKEKEERRFSLDAEINSKGGARLQTIEQDIKRKETEIERRKVCAENYNRSAAALSLPACDNAGYFADNMRRVNEVAQSLENAKAKLQNERMENFNVKKKAEEELKRLNAEIHSLSLRRTNIVSGSIALRKRIAEALDISEDDIPFAGELIEVRSEEKAWEGAAERLLHNFGLSLLVHDKYYKAVSDWVEGNNMNGRLVYYRVRADEKAPAINAADNSLIGKLALKEESQFYHWLLGELSRFDYVCCDSMDEFRREQKAVTRNGQIKSGGKRHEKDDRYNIADRSRYILGWNNRDKIAQLQREAREFDKAVEQNNKIDGRIRGELREIDAKATAASKLADFLDFSELDWKSSAKDAVDLRSEQNVLLAASRELEALKNLRTELEKEITNIEAEYKDAVFMEGSNNNSLGSYGKLLEDEKTLLTEEQVKRHEPAFGLLEAISKTMYGSSAVTAENAVKRRREISERLAEQIRTLGSEATLLSSRLVGKMVSFKSEYVVETQEFDTAIESAGEYLRMLTQLRKDDLPRFEVKFRKMLKEKTVQEIASFHENLNKMGRIIEDKIDMINGALAQVDYGPGRYIRLEAEREKTMEIRQFQSDLRVCTQDVIGLDNSEGLEEKRFENIESIIKRFKGRPNSSSEDRKWTERVTDVRNWYTFAASERWREDDSEYEHYSDSSGKSGGQKEKLAYTILAASLAYQFGLTDDTQLRPRTFRFVMIDEAFGRGSDESAQFALELFKKLDLQLLVATPLTKIQVIEPFVSEVTFIANKDGHDSSMRNLTIEEYLEEKKQINELDEKR